MVEKITIERFPDRASALSAERHGIHHEKPVYNRLHSTTRTKPKADKTTQNGKTERFTTYLTPAQVAWLRAKCAEVGVSEGIMLRMLVIKQKAMANAQSA